jgi:transcription elongation factor GreB
VQFLRKRLEGMTVVDVAAPGARRDAGRVYFGAWVQLESDSGSLSWYRLVGPDEFDMAGDYISMDSPLGSSLLGKRLDDSVTVALPAGDQTFTVIAISYGPRP